MIPKIATNIYHTKQYIAGYTGRGKKSKPAPMVISSYTWLSPFLPVKNSIGYPGIVVSSVKFPTAISENHTNNPSNITLHSVLTTCNQTYYWHTLWDMRLLSSSVRRPSSEIRCLSCGHISKTRQTYSYYGTVLVSWQHWFCYHIQILPQMLSWGDIWFQIQNVREY